MPREARSPERRRSFRRRRRSAQEMLTGATYRADSDHAFISSRGAMTSLQFGQVRARAWTGIVTRTDSPGFVSDLSAPRLLSSHCTVSHSPLAAGETQWYPKRSGKSPPDGQVFAP